MKGKVHGIIVLLRFLIVILCFATLLTIFVYTPFYSKSALWFLDKIVNIQVDPIAAESQRPGLFDTLNNLEPGSPKWVARRAYLYEVNRSLENSNGQSFIELQQRYHLLLKKIDDEYKLNQQHLTIDDIENLDDQNADSITPDFLKQFQDAENEPLFEQYREFLTQQEHLVNLTPNKHEDLDVELESPFAVQKPAHLPHAIVVLGGGLTSGLNKGEIIVNLYTKKRLEQTLEIYKKYPLPIVLSGVESPYMQKWLQQHHIHAELLENRSMNTCENTRFSSLLLQKQGGAPTVFLITDAYHMPRSQRLFALNGIVTIPIIAPLPNELTDWQPDSHNLMHSRRATYEILATLRDIWFGESNCREIP